MGRSVVRKNGATGCARIVPEFRPTRHHIVRRLSSFRRSGRRKRSRRDRFTMTHLVLVVDINGEVDQSGLERLRSHLDLKKQGRLSDDWDQEFGYRKIERSTASYTTMGLFQELRRVMESPSARHRRTRCQCRRICTTTSRVGRRYHCGRISGIRAGETYVRHESIDVGESCRTQWPPHSPDVETSTSQSRNCASARLVPHSSQPPHGVRSNGNSSGADLHLRQKEPQL